MLEHWLTEININQNRKKQIGKESDYIGWRDNLKKRQRILRDTENGDNWNIESYSKDKLSSVVYLVITHKNWRWFSFPLDKKLTIIPIH